MILWFNHCGRPNSLTGLRSGLTPCRGGERERARSFTKQAARVQNSKHLLPIHKVLNFHLSFWTQSLSETMGYFKMWHAAILQNGEVQNLDLRWSMNGGKLPKWPGQLKDCFSLAVSSQRYCCSKTVGQIPSGTILWLLLAQRFGSIVIAGSVCWRQKWSNLDEGVEERQIHISYI